MNIRMMILEGWGGWVVRGNDDVIITLEGWGGWVVGANDDGIMKVIKIAAVRRQKNVFNSVVFKKLISIVSGSLSDKFSIYTPS